MIQWKDSFYNEFLKKPSKDTFSSFLKSNVGSWMKKPLSW